MISGRTVSRERTLDVWWSLESPEALYLWISAVLGMKQIGFNAATQLEIELLSYWAIGRLS